MKVNAKYLIIGIVLGSMLTVGATLVRFPEEIKELEDTRTKSQPRTEKQVEDYRQVEAICGVDNVDDYCFRYNPNESQSHRCIEWGFECRSVKKAVHPEEIE